MGDLRTHISGIFLALCLSASNPVYADVTPQVRMFATCTGRLSALMEHQWMFDGDASEVTEARRATFVTLLDSLLPYAKEDGIQGQDVLNWRIEAKMAQAELLQRAVFGTSERETKRAVIVSNRFLAQCTSLLLS